ncbi:NAD(P)/FAD-dependent oxidoreductase [Nitratireductor sp. XY-223]|uniref:phytoene desaturase family protein n=1 Tax=Nitratireductor sp. XY-223 TaxID=2561926 RepID=UPI00197D6433|nr:NAD(P)/FAD-dependent oxidoreductase [Nitratireductor sp. XY-223]
MLEEFDAAIIGSGHNSLVCAAHLQQKGWRTIVLEQASEPGGAVKTLELTEPGFRHDWAAMNLSLFAGSAFNREYAEKLGACGLEFVPADKCFASVFPDGKWLGVGTDLAATRERIAAFSEADAETWGELVEEFPGKAEYIFALLGSPMKTHIQGRLLAKALWKKGGAWTTALARLLIASPRTWLSETFESDHVRATLAAWGMHLDFAPDIAGGAIFPYLESMANQSFGMVIGKGGADTLTRALLALVEEGGGTVRCGSAVTRIVTDGPRATGVELGDGTRIAAKRAVVANISPRNLAELTGGGTGDADFDRAMAGYAHAPGTMMMHLALSELPDWKASPKLREFAYVHIAPSLDQMARTYQQAVAGLLPDEPVIVVGQPTAIDPSRAPEGKHVLWVQVRMVPAEIAGDAKGEIGGGDWDQVKEAYAERVMDLIEAHAPGLRKNIIARHIVSPLDLQADNPNLVGGDQICGSHHLTQHFLFRPRRGFASGNTPVKDLHLTGAAVWPGAGTGAGPGYLLARKLAGT